MNVLHSVAAVALVAFANCGAARLNVLRRKALIFLAANLGKRGEVTDEKRSRLFLRAESTLPGSPVKSASLSGRAAGMIWKHRPLVLFPARSTALRARIVLLSATAMPRAFSWRW